MWQYGYRFNHAALLCFSTNQYRAVTANCVSTYSISEFICDHEQTILHHFCECINNLSIGETLFIILLACILKPCLSLFVHLLYVINCAITSYTDLHLYFHESESESSNSTDVCIVPNMNSYDSETESSSSETILDTHQGTSTTMNDNSEMEVSKYFFSENKHKHHGWYT